MLIFYTYKAKFRTIYNKIKSIMHKIFNNVFKTWKSVVTRVYTSEPVNNNHNNYGECLYTNLIFTVMLYKRNNVKGNGVDDFNDT